MLVGRRFGSQTTAAIAVAVVPSRISRARMPLWKSEGQQQLVSMVPNRAAPGPLWPFFYVVVSGCLYGSRIEEEGRWYHV